MKQKIIFSLFISTCIMLGCKKNEFRTSEYDIPSGKAYLKVAYFCPDTTNPLVQCYVNDNLVQTTISNNTPFPGGGLNTGGGSANGYLAVDPSKGAATIKFSTINPGTSLPNKELFSFTLPVVANTQQVAFITDTGVNRSAFMVNVDTERPDSGFVKMRFINCIPNAGPMSFYFKNVLIADNVKYKEVLDFKAIPLATDTLKLYPTGTPTNVTPLALYSFSTIGNRKVYTTICRGFLGSGHAQAKPAISLVIVN
jgi:hypothetical protein